MIDVIRKIYRNTCSVAVNRSLGGHFIRGRVAKLGSQTANQSTCDSSFPSTEESLTGLELDLGVVLGAT